MNTLSAPHTDGRVPAVEDGEHPKPPSLGVIIERRRVGKVNFTAVLCAHVPEYAAEISQALRDSEVVAIEEVGHANDAQRRSYEQLYTHLLSSQLNQNRIDAAFAEITAAQFGVPSLISPLRGTDKQVVLLDINQDDPSYGMCAEAKQARVDFVDAVSQLAPTTEIRAIAAQSADTIARSDETREAVVSQQIQGVIDQANSQADAPSVAVVVGSNHFRVIEGMGDDTSPEASQEVSNKVEESSYCFDRAVLAVRSGENEDVRAEWVDRSILSVSMFLLAFGPGIEHSRQADRLAKKADPATVRRILSGLDGYLLDPALDQTAKLQGAQLFLQSIASMLETL